MENKQKNKKTNSYFNYFLQNTFLSSALQDRLEEEATSKVEVKSYETANTRQDISDRGRYTGNEENDQI